MTEAIKRTHATEVQARFGQIVQEVVTTDVPVIIQTQGGDQVVLISLRDFQRLRPAREENGRTLERERVRAALQAAGLLSQPTTQEAAEVRAFEAQHPPEDQERILAEWRRLDIVPSLSEIVLCNREQVR